MQTAPESQVFVELIEQHKAIIYKICNAYCASRMQRDDLAQEIVCELWRSFKSYKNEFKFSTWLYRVALNVAISYYRKESKSAAKVELSDNLMLFEENTDGGLEDNVQLLQQFISALKPLDKSVMLLYLDDRSYKEIAIITGISVTNVATKISRIKEILKLNFKRSEKQ